MFFLPPRPAIVLLCIVLEYFPASSAWAHGDLHDRIAALSVQLFTNQSTPELWLLRADLRRQHGEFAAAGEDLDQAMQLKPGWAPAFLLRARICFDAEKFSACEQAATACLELKSASADALVLRARARVCLGKLLSAVADYDAVLDATNSAAPTPDLYLERARASAALQRWDDAIRGLDAGMQRLGPTPSLALPAIEFERQRGAFAAALARLEQSRKFFSEESYAQLRAEILKQADKP